MKQAKDTVWCKCKGNFATCASCISVCSVVVCKHADDFGKVVKQALKPPSGVNARGARILPHVQVAKSCIAVCSVVVRNICHM